MLLIHRHEVMKNLQLDQRHGLCCINSIRIAL